MPTRCIVCIGANIKSAMVERITGRSLSDQILAFPDCTHPDTIELDEATCNRKERREPGKRAPSAYNNFISTCMKGKHIHGFANAAPAMRECAQAWKARPK
jgi:hypothetical protein